MGCLVQPFIFNNQPIMSDKIIFIETDTQVPEELMVDAQSLITNFDLPFYITMDRILKHFDSIRTFLHLDYENTEGDECDLDLSIC